MPSSQKHEGLLLCNRWLWFEVIAGAIPAILPARDTVAVRVRPDLSRVHELSLNQ